MREGATENAAIVAELLSDTGGVTYGKTAPNSPHATMVGAAPIPNPAAATDPEAAKFLFSGTADTKGNVPGPCVTCHQWPIIADSKDPNYQKVGGHSFNTVSPDGTFDYTAACKSCHGDMKDFNFKAKADYDGNGKVEGVQDEVKGLLNTLWGALEKAGVKKIDTGYPYATLPTGADGKVDPKIQNAWYNFRTVYGVMWGAEGAGNEHPPLQISFIHTLHLCRSFWTITAAFKDILPASCVPLMFQRVLDLLRQQRSQPRRARSCPRALRQPVSNWPRLRKNVSSTRPFEFKVIRKRA